MAENLRKKTVTYVSWNFIFKDSNEYVDHLLLHYRVAS